MNVLRQTLFHAASIHAELDCLKQFIYFMKCVSGNDEMTVQPTGWKVVVRFPVRAWINFVTSVSIHA